MPAWIRNLKTSLEDRQVLILHGNVRDQYIDQHGRIYENLTELLAQVVAELPLSFSECVRYDTVDDERPLLPSDTNTASLSCTGKEAKRKRQILPEDSSRRSPHLAFWLTGPNAFRSPIVTVARFSTTWTS